MLDRAEQRSKQLGIANTQKNPLTEVNQEPVSQPPSGGVAAVKRQNTRRKSASSPQKQKNTLTMTRRTPSKRTANNGAENENEEAKENLDVALEINITAGHNVQVKCSICIEQPLFCIYAVAFGFLGASRSRGTRNRC